MSSRWRWRGVFQGHLRQPLQVDAGCTQAHRRALILRKGRVGGGIIASMPAPAPWLLYLLECRNGSYYCGITNDLESRLRAHAQGRGARYTRANPPLRVLASRPFPDRASASRAEWQLKQLPKARKLPWLLDQRPG
jgi:putative endonuclease